MGKLIAKTAAITLVCVLALLLVLYAVFRLFVPSVLVAVTDRLGWDAACARYSVMQYNKSDSTEDLCDAVERNYYVSGYGNAAALGKELIKKSDFQTVCQEKDKKIQAKSGASLQYYTGITAVSEYECDDAAAIDTAMSALTDGVFPDENAAVILAVAAMDKGDKEFCSRLSDKLDSFNPIEHDAEYFHSFQKALQDFCK